MSDLFTKLFETFGSISQHDASNGDVNGIKSIYSIPSKDLTGITVDSLNDDRSIKQKISNLYRINQYSIGMERSTNIEGFSKFSQRISNALDLNKIYSDDASVRQKLADFLTYCYLSVNNEKTFLIYPDFDSAKKVSLMVFTKAEKTGLKFLNTDTADVLKTVLLTVFFQLPKEKK
jgi:hypothetical protein